MADNSKLKEFPELSSKLTAPTKKSLFERQKAEAEAKRAREKAETAAVYEDFVKSFDDESDDIRPSRSELSGRLSGPGPGSSGHGGMGGPSRRHFTGSSAPSRTSGPGSLGPLPPSFTKKRTFDGEPANRRDNNRGLFAFEDTGPGHNDAAAAFQESDEDEEQGISKAMDKAAAKPTLHLSSLPPGISPAAIKALIPAVLAVENVKIMPSTSGNGERKSSSAIVTLAADTAASDIDTAVNSIQNKYLGWGFNLSISRYLSSAAVNAAMPVSVGAGLTASQPFGARQIPHAGGCLSRAPPPSSGRGYAPPSSYAPGAHNRPPPTQVTVTAPSDLRQVRLIHKTLESLLTHGPEFEALLMSRPEVQKDEKWSWLWNPRSQGGVYYRWRLWDILTDSQRLHKPGFPGARQAHVFERETPWVPPEFNLQYEYTTQLDEFVSDQDYNSSDEESEDEGRRRHHRDHRQPLGTGGVSDPSDPSHNPDGPGYLNPLQKAKLTHLLARLPATNARLRKGDVARVTAFAIEHAGSGADEVVDMIVSNVSTPYSYTSANPDYQPDNERLDELENQEDTPDPTSTSINPEDKEKGLLDTSPARLIGLYLISDILSTSSTSGVRHAWRYRSLFEASLRSHQTFAKLGRVEKEHRWGRLKAEKWRRSIMNVLTLWEGWCVFPQESQDLFVELFNKPPLTEKEKREEEEASRKRKVDEERLAAGSGGSGGKSKWRTVDEKEENQRIDFGTTAQNNESMDIDGESHDVDGEEMVDGDLDGEVMEDDDLDGVPMVDDDDEDEAMKEDENIDREAILEAPDAAASKEMDTNGEESGQNKDELNPGLGSPGMKRKPVRMKAVDMFADSDDE